MTYAAAAYRVRASFDEGHMTTEEKLDKLIERVDAIARNLELLSTMQVKTEESMGRLAETSVILSRMVLEHDERIERLEGN